MKIESLFLKTRLKTNFQVNKMVRSRSLQTALLLFSLSSFGKPPQPSTTIVLDGSYSTSRKACIPKNDSTVRGRIPVHLNPETIRTADFEAMLVEDLLQEFETGRPVSIHTFGEGQRTLKGCVSQKNLIPNVPLSESRKEHLYALRHFDPSETPRKPTHAQSKLTTFMEGMPTLLSCPPDWDWEEDRKFPSRSRRGFSPVTETLGIVLNNLNAKKVRASRINSKEPVGLDAVPRVILITNGGDNVDKKCKSDPESLLAKYKGNVVLDVISMDWYSDVNQVNSSSKKQFENAARNSGGKFFDIGAKDVLFRTEKLKEILKYYHGPEVEMEAYGEIIHPEEPHQEQSTPHQNE